MKTLNFSQNCHSRLVKYVSKLKNKESFKYVKGMTGNERVLANIIYSRGLQGEYAVKLTPREAEAFGIKIESDTMFCADVLGNKVSIIPLCSPEEYK